MLGPENRTGCEIGGVAGDSDCIPRTRGPGSLGVVVGEQWLTGCEWVLLMLHFLDLRDAAALSVCLVALYLQ